MARILTNISLTRRKDIKIQLIHSFSFHIHNIWKANKLFAQETTAKFCQVSSFVIHHRGTIVTCNKLFLLLAKLNRCIDGKNFLKKSSVFFLFLFFFSLEEFFELTFFSSPSFTRLSPSSLFQWHDTLLNFSLNRGNSVPPLSPLFFLSLPPPISRFFHSPLPLFLVISDPSGLSVAKSSFSSPSPSTSRQSNLIKVYPCSVSALSVSHQPRLFFYLRSSLRRSPGISWLVVLLWTNGNLNNPVHKPLLNAGQWNLMLRSWTARNMVPVSHCNYAIAVVRIIQLLDTRGGGWK